MIIVKSPFRIMLSGGGTDFEDYFTEFGPVLSTGFTISKYCYVNLTHLPNINGTNFQIAYSSFERVQNISDIQNNGVRGTLQYVKNNVDYDFHKLSIHIINEISPKTGVGSSSAMICSLLKAIYTFINKEINKKELAKSAIKIERSKEYLNEAGGWNDQIITSFGDFNSILIKKDKTFNVKPLSLTLDFKDYFSKCCILYYTNENNSRDSFNIAKSYNNKDSYNNKKEITNLSYQIKEELEKENIENIGKLIHRSFLEKRKISNLISNEYIDNLYYRILNSGAIGGRLMGSGGAGFIFTVYPSPEYKNIACKNIGIDYIDINLDNEGTKVIFNQE